MLQLNVNNETSRLRAVVLGSAVHNGPTPKVEQAYDPKSLEHILAGTYPKEKDMVEQMEAFNTVLRKYNIKVYRPQIIENYNQIFARDIGFVIDDTFVKSNILPDRERELDAIQYIIDQIDPKKWCVLLPRFISKEVMLCCGTIMCSLEPTKEVTIKIILLQERICKEYNILKIYFQIK